MQNIKTTQDTEPDPEDKIRDFVNQFDSGVQRGEGWDRGKFVGGSEIGCLAALTRPMYSSAEELMNRKLGFDSFVGNFYCDWGTVFEDVLTGLVEIDLGCEIYGDTIWIQSKLTSGHSNSPDGYMVVTMGTDPPRLLTTADPPVEASIRVPVIIEMKNPYVRVPNGTVGSGYYAQIQNGILLSPPVEAGLFIDSAFRRCSVAQLGPEPGFDMTLHRKPSAAVVKKNPGADMEYTRPYAWGVTGIFVPELPKDVFDPQVARVAGMANRIVSKARRPSCAGPDDVVDLSLLNWFDTRDLFRMIAGKEIRMHTPGVTFSDRRGGELKNPAVRECGIREDPTGPGRGPRNLPAVLEQMRDHGRSIRHTFVGLIPWKNMMVHYVMVPPDADLIPEIPPAVDEFWAEWRMLMTTAGAVIDDSSGVMVIKKTPDESHLHAVVNAWRRARVRSNKSDAVVRRANRGTPDEPVVAYLFTAGTLDVDIDMEILATDAAAVTAAAGHEKDMIDMFTEHFG